MPRVIPPIGIESFRELREKNCYYIDKTCFIEDIMEDSFKVLLFTRPRRFGKTLTMSMLADFLDIRMDSRQLFEGLQVSKNDSLCRKWMNQRPVLLATRLITDILFDTISYFDYREDYYHAFLTGLFTGAGYAVESNHEYGLGKPDLVVWDRKIVELS